MNLEPDLEARELWKSVDILEDHILPSNMKIISERWERPVPAIPAPRYIMMGAGMLSIYATTAKAQLIYRETEFLKTTKTSHRLFRTYSYAEQGGHFADERRILTSDVAEFEVHEVQQYVGYIVETGDEVICECNELRRQPIRNNHTATHILNHSLSDVLGDDINLEGSSVDQDKL
ncbi:hypothetical protein GGR55DRAFT_678995 [Xylaria sp. FL0064]|nr:hypothetical protein GGR55DRAFT_678995 [Xylaria sp. FL0064]